MAYIRNYSLQWMSSDTKDIDYKPVWDGSIPNKECIRLLVSKLESLHKEGISPIVAVFVPKE